MAGQITMDIVERLRFGAMAAEKEDADEHCSGVTIIAIRYLREAANEIERLRAALTLGRTFMQEQTDENAAAFEKALASAGNEQSTPNAKERT